MKSRQKGKVGEREAVALLRQLGFADAVRASQVSGKFAADVLCPSLDPLFIEVKYGYPSTVFAVGSSVFVEACDQAEADAAGRPWVVLWRNKGSRRWNATGPLAGFRVTIAEPSIRDFLVGLIAA